MVEYLRVHLKMYISIVNPFQLTQTDLFRIFQRVQLEYQKVERTLKRINYFFVVENR